MSNKKVIVVGAGCAGLSATYTLRKHGVDVITFESRATAMVFFKVCQYP
jgi:protoporphyrinogen/coproporphyrinogen III oxidase